jgi:hypothetical protein
VHIGLTLLPRAVLSAFLADYIFIAVIGGFGSSRYTPGMGLAEAKSQSGSGRGIHRGRSGLERPPSAKSIEF